MYYSATTNAFYPASHRQQHEARGTWPEDAVEVTDQEYGTYGQGRPPVGMRRGPDADGRPNWVEIPPEPLADLATRQRTAIDTARDAAFAAGMPYTLPDGSEDVVQTRAGVKTNLLGLAVEARDLKAAGETGAVMEFRGEKNVTHDITPQEMIDLTSAALGYIKQVYAQSWDRKDTIDAALADETLADDEKRDAIAAVVW